jgi:hypothetical protein
LSEQSGYSPILCPVCGRLLGTLITHPGVVLLPSIISTYHGRRWIGPAAVGVSIGCEGTRDKACPGVWEYTGEAANG